MLCRVLFSFILKVLVCASFLPLLDVFLQISRLNAGLFYRPFAGFHTFAFTPAETFLALGTTTGVIWLCNPEKEKLDMQQHPCAELW